MNSRNDSPTVGEIVARRHHGTSEKKDMLGKNHEKIFCDFGVQVLREMDFHAQFRNDFHFIPCPPQRSMSPKLFFRALSPVTTRKT